MARGNAESGTQFRLLGFVFVDGTQCRCYNRIRKINLILANRTYYICIRYVRRKSEED